MKTKNLKKVLLYTFSTALLLVVVLFVHIYMVYRPKAPDANTRIMARIDIKQPINANQAEQIKAWLLHQKGVDHALVNPETSIAVFTFFPIKTNGDAVVNNFRSAFGLKANRFMPTAQQIASGCPAGGTSSFAYKIYSFINQII